MKTIFTIFISFLMFIPILPAENSTVGQVLAVRPGNEADAGKLGYGWSYPESLSDGTTMRWIEKREGDVYVIIQEPAAFHLALEVMPIVSDRRIQNFGVYVNNRYVSGWELEPVGRFQWFETDVPAGYFRSGTNTVTIRSGYKTVPDADPRTLSLAVKQVLLTSHE